MRPYIFNPDAVLSVEPTSDAASALQATVAALPPAVPRASGLFSAKHKLPRDCQWLAAEMQAISNQLIEAVVAKHGEVSIYHSAIIETVLKHHKRLRLLERWLIRPHHQARTPANDPHGRNRTAAIPLAERIQLVKEEALATEARAKAIKDLGLSESIGDESPDWGKIFGQGMKAGVEVAKNNSAIESQPTSEAR